MIGIPNVDSTSGLSTDLDLDQCPRNELLSRIWCVDTFKCVAKLCWLHRRVYLSSKSWSRESPRCESAGIVSHSDSTRTIRSPLHLATYVRTDTAQRTARPRPVRVTRFPFGSGFGFDRLSTIRSETAQAASPLILPRFGRTSCLGLAGSKRLTARSCHTATDGSVSLARSSHRAGGGRRLGLAPRLTL